MSELNITLEHQHPITNNPLFTNYQTELACAVVTQNVILEGIVLMELGLHMVIQMQRLNALVRMTVIAKELFHTVIKILTNA